MRKNHKLLSTMLAMIVPIIPTNLR